jgi:hypothetical protein
MTENKIKFEMIFLVEHPKSDTVWQLSEKSILTKFTFMPQTHIPFKENRKKNAISLKSFEITWSWS